MLQSMGSQSQTLLSNWTTAAEAWQGKSLALNDPVLPTCSAFRGESDNVRRIVKSDLL